MEPEVLRLSINGHHVECRRAGSGPALLLVHGMAGRSSTWKPVMAELAEHFTVIAPDLPGHGRSDKPRSDYSLGAYATFLRDLLIDLDIDRATVVGQSLGGGITMQFAYQHPELCERLVLVSAGGLGTEVSPLLRALTVPGVDYLMPLAFLPVLSQGALKIAELASKVGLKPSAQTVQMFNAYDSLADGDTRTAFLHTLRSVVDRHGQRVSALDRLHLASEMPTLIVWGDRDHIIPVQHAYDAHAAIPQSRLEIFEGAGHFAHAEEPLRFARLLHEFVSTTKPLSPATARDLRRKHLAPAGDQDATPRGA
ncbi:MAG: alpha/beta fold hydrolase [Aquihabitans sp.]